MRNLILLDAVYKPSDDIVARTIEGELIIVPLVAGIGDMEDDLFTLNASGNDIWRRLDGKTTVRRIIQDLAKEYAATPDAMTRDVIGLLRELLKRRMLVETRVP
ncbi:MAG: PqqD family protein [Lentisphaerae bacterium]|nr:PqqD family protein [Lentisphaerota bacterium]